MSGCDLRVASIVALVSWGLAFGDERPSLWRSDLHGAPADCTERLAALQAGREQRPDSRLSRLTELSRACEQSDAVWAALAAAALDLGRFEQARSALDRAQKLAPESPDPRRAFHLGFLLSTEGQWTASLEAYRLAARLGGLPGSEHWLLDFDRGDTLMALGRLDEALSAYRRAADQAPTESLTHLALAVALDRQGLSLRSRAELKLAERFNPKIARLDRAHYVFTPSGEVHYYRALLSMAHGDWQEARRALGAFLTALPDSPYAGRARDHLRALSAWTP